MEEIVTAAETAAEAIAETTAAVAGVSFNPMNFITNLTYMAKGMLGIFVVIAIIWLTTIILNKVSAFAAARTDNSEDTKQ
ncbi:MAG: hypothetical protein GX628_09085 [Clostridiales bacterium]|nr:hypothetical protein [Clostridiales bacterium]